LINSGRRGKLDRLLEGYGDSRGLAEEEGIITAIPKTKAEDLLEVIRNGMDRDREVSLYRQEQRQQPQQPSISMADELMKLANLKEKGVISEDEFQQMKQDLIKKK
jgi:hypothetical protein